MRPILLFVSLLFTLALAGCYTAEETIIPVGYAPFASFTMKAGEGDKEQLFVREGDGYVLREGTREMRMRFMDIGGGLYIAEASGDDNGKTRRLYGGVRYFPEQGKAEGYRMVADESDAAPGLRLCEDGDVICIDDVEAFAAVIRADIENGVEPTQTYTIAVKAE